MAFLIGGDTDKRGNYYENKFVTYSYAKLLSGEIKSIQQETYHQEEEKGVDVIISLKNNEKIYYQCKSRNGMKHCWDIEDLKEVIKKAIKHTNSCKFFLVSPLQTNHGLADLCQRSRSFTTLKDFEDNALGGQKQREIYDKIIKLLPYSTTEEILNLFHNFDFLYFPDQKSHVTDYLTAKAYIRNVDKAYDLLCSYIESNEKLQTPIYYDEIYNYLKKMGISFFAVDKDNDNRVVKNIQESFIDSLNRRRINDKDYIRTEEIDTVYNLMFENKFTILNGESGCGKSIIAKQICSRLNDNNICFLPIDFSTYLLNTTYINFCLNLLGLTGTISMSIDKINTKEKAFIIIDQMDTIQWGSPLDRQAQDLCHEIIKESLNYKNINIVFITRTINTEDIIKIIDYEIREYGPEKISKKTYTINKLDEKFIKKIIPEYDSLSSPLKNLLANPNNIKYYLDIKSKNKNKIGTINELIRTYLNECFQLFKEDENSAKELIKYIVDTLKRENVLFINKSDLHKFSERVINILKSNGIIIEINGIIKFSHQSLYDYYIAEKLYEDLEKRIKPNVILRNYKDEPIENYNRIKQFLEMLFKDSSNFCTNIKLILFDVKVPFIFKKIAINYFTLADENYNGFINLYKRLITSKQYGKKYLYNLTAGKNVLFNVLAKNKIIDNLINSNKKEDNVLAINILLSLQNSIDTTKYLDNFISSHNSKDVLESIIHQIDDLKSSDQWFERKIKLLSENKYEHLYINWSEIVKNNKERAYKYLLLLFTSDQYIENTLNLEYKELKQEVDSLLLQYKHDLLKVIKNFINKYISHFKKSYYQDAGINIYNNEDVALFIYSLIIPFLNANEIWDEINNNELKYIAFINLEKVNNDIGGELLKMMIKYNYIKDQNFHYNPPFIFKLQHFINKFSTQITKIELNKLIKQIVNYKNPKLIEFAKERFAQRKTGIFHHFYEEEQKVLLNGIPSNILPECYKNYLMYLNRKFEKPEMFSETYVYGIQSYSVVSGINKNNKKWSKKSYVKLLKSQNAGKASEFTKKEKLDKNGNLISCDDYHIKQFIYDSAYQHRQLFLEILLQESDLRKDFVVTIFNALSNKYSNKNFQEDCDPSELLKAYKKYYNSNKSQLISPLIDFAQNYSYFDQWLIDILVSSSFVKSNIKDDDCTNTDFNSEWNKHFNDIQSGSIVGLSKYLWNCKDEPEWWDKLYNLCLDSNKLYMALACVDIILPLYNINPNKATQLLYELMIKYPNIIAYSDCWKIIDRTITDYNKQFEKIFSKQIAKLENKMIQNLTNRYVCYYVYYDYFEKELKRIIKSNGEFNLSFVCNELLSKNLNDISRLRLVKIIKYIAKYNPLETNNFLYHLEDNIAFYNQNRLLKRIILKSKDKYNREFYIHNIDSIFAKLPSIIEYENLIYEIVKKYINNRRNSLFYISNILQWLLRLYRETTNKKTKKKCIKIINYLYKEQLFNLSSIDLII